MAQKRQKNGTLSDPTQRKKSGANSAALKLAVEARALAARGDVQAAADTFERAFASAPTDLDVLTVAADGLTGLGERDRALDMLQQALSNCEPNEAVLIIIGRLAQQMEMHDVAIKVFHAAIGMNPGNPGNYTNLANSYRLLQKFEEGIAVIQEVLPLMPEAASLWNVLATLLLHGRKDYENAKTFYLEALRLEPNNDQALLNLANISGDRAESQRYYEQAVAANDSNHEAHIGLALHLLVDGDIETAWPHYEHRLKIDTSFSKAVFATNRLPMWKGGDLSDKTILVMPEQGIGDEVLFSVLFPQLIAKAKRVILGCDPRLVTIYQRSFPTAVVVAYEDTRMEGRRYRSFPAIEDDKGRIKDANCAIWAGSLTRYFWPNIDSIPVYEGGHLKPDPDLVAHFGDILAGNGAGPRVGMSWRSGNLTFNRDEGYIGLRGGQWLLRWMGRFSDFYCLQYGWDPEEISLMETNSEQPLRTFDGVDLKADIEANLAIMANLDLVVGPPIATQQFAIAAGVETRLVTGGPPWWSFGTGGAKGPFFWPHCRWYHRETGNYKEPIEAIVKDAREAYPNSPHRTGLE